MTVLAELTRDDLEEIQGTRLLLNVDLEGTRALDWALENRDAVERLLHESGGLLIRGLRFLGSQQFGAVLTALFGEDLLQYTYRSTPRTELRGNVYTATEYHPSQIIPQHNESSYSNRWAMRIGFMCTIPAAEGGATPICDSRRVYQQIPPEVRRRFERYGVMYVRNYSQIDIPWTEVFQTDDKADVEHFCHVNQLELEWLSDSHLRTRQVNQASAVHPVTAENVWFNQAHLFHISNLDAQSQQALMIGMKEEELPRNAYYGDGAPIEPETLRIIREIYDRNQIAFTWQRNDLLLLDNMLYSHGRGTYAGSRQVLVGMARLQGAGSPAA
jgi:alpha-ketoglutarate-dependent taurine dioxygenase